ncbi:MAG: radical SAM protein [Candidatus Sumerlaeia bacterium]|nr:radical SAM protein [Candidatus Sumerlaeia bacterium]
MLDLKNKIIRLKSIIKNQLVRRPRGFFTFVLTIEPSFACNLSCQMCPRGENVAGKEIMSEETFNKIEPYLKRFHFVHICGFGEPLMNPRLELMLERICNYGCVTSLVTNGLLLNPERIQRLLSPPIRLKEIAISIDSAHSEQYESIRKKGSFERLVENIRELKKQINTSAHKPKLTWAFLVMKSNFAELPDAVELAARLGFDRIVGKHLETARTREELVEALYDTGYVPPPNPVVEQQFQSVLREARKLARKYSISFEMHPRRLIIDRTCASQPLRALYIDYAGNVSSCCYLTVKGFRPYLDREISKENSVWGNVLENTLDEILTAEKFQKFTAYWAEGKLPPVCEGCLLARRMTI